MLSFNPSANHFVFISILIYMVILYLILKNRQKCRLPVLIILLNPLQNKNVLSLMISNKSIPQQGIQEMMELLVQAGYNLHRTSWTSSTVQSSTISKKTCLDLSQKLADSPEQFLSTWLDRRKLCIPSLAQLCRARIRKRLNYCNCGRSIVRSLTFLPIPALLMDFLSLRDEPSLKLK